MTPIKQEFSPLTKQINTLFERQGITIALQEEFIFKAFGEITIVSDYREEDTDYPTYVFLCTTKDLLQVWHDSIKDLRKNSKLGKRKMAYKKLNDKIRVQALPQWLSLINHIDGHLIVISVDKKLPSVFANDLKELDAYMVKQGFTMWHSPEVKEKALRITHLVSYLMSLCTRDSQNFYWITDRDPIVDNQEQREGLCHLFARVYPIYFNHSLGKVRFLVPLPEILDERLELFVEDVLSIPDLVCGAVSDGLSAFYQQHNKSLKEAIGLIYNFLNDRSRHLHKHLIHITAEQIGKDIGIGGQLYTIGLSGVNLKMQQSSQIDTEDKLLHLANNNSIQASTLYHKALSGGVPNPIIFILDLRDETAKNIAMKVTKAEYIIEKYLKYCQYTQRIPTMVLALPQRIGVKICKVLDPKGSEYLAGLPKPGHFHVVVLSDGSCLVGGLPID